MYLRTSYSGSANAKINSVSISSGLRISGISSGTCVTAGNVSGTAGQYVDTSYARAVTIEGITGLPYGNTTVTVNINRSFASSYDSNGCTGVESGYSATDPVTINIYRPDHFDIGGTVSVFSQNNAAPSNVEVDQSASTNYSSGQSAINLADKGDNVDVGASVKVQPGSLAKWAFAAKNNDSRGDKWVVLNVKSNSSLSQGHDRGSQLFISGNNNPYRWGINPTP
jgi:hypothetical protein